VPDDASDDQPETESSNAGDAALAHDATTPSRYSYTVVDDDTADDDAEGDPAPQRTGGIAPLALVGAVLAAAIIAGGVVWFLASSGSGGDSRLGADVTNVLNAFSTGQSGTVTTRYEGELPPGFPSDIPTYSSAKVVSSLAQVTGADVGYLVIWDTGDARDKVAASFSTKFNADPWQIDGGQDGRDSTIHQFSKINDPNVTGLVLVAASKDDKTTTILESIEVVAGASSSKTPPFAAISDRTLPDGFPNTLPGYAGSTIIQSAYKKAPGTQSFAISYITKDGPATVLDYYRGKLTAANLTPTAGDASTSALTNATAVDFVDAAKTTQGEVVVGGFPEDASYTEIDVSLQITKAGATSPLSPPQSKTPVVPPDTTPGAADTTPPAPQDASPVAPPATPAAAPATP
jgi:hypothetical protein